MNSIDKIISWVIGLVILVLIVWWSGGAIIKSIRAPVVARAEAAEKANTSVVEDNTRLKKDNERLNGLLAARTEREAKSEQRLKRIEDGIKDRAKNDPVLRSWLDVLLPDGLFIVPKTSAGNTDSKAGVFGAIKPDRANQATASVGTGEGDQQRLVEPQGNTGKSADPVQSTVGRCSGVETGACGAYNRLFGKVK